MAAQPLTNPERLERLLSLLDESLDREAIRRGLSDPTVIRDLTIAMRQLDGFVEHHATKAEADAATRRALDAEAALEEATNRLDNLTASVDELRTVIGHDRDYIAQVLEGERLKPLRDAIEMLIVFLDPRRQDQVIA